MSKRIAQFFFLAILLLVFFASYEAFASNDSNEVPASSSAFAFPTNAFIIEVSRDCNENVKILALKDGFLQFWLNYTLVCEKKIPVPAKVSIGSGFYQVIGNPYISEDDSLVLIQSYTTPEGEPKLDYTILAKDCRKIVPTLNYNCYLFQNYEGKYGLAYYHTSPLPYYIYEGFGFNDLDNDFPLLTPKVIWLDTKTVKMVNFGSWGSTSYGYQDISAISTRLYVDGYGEVDVSSVYDLSEPVEVDCYFFDSLREKFAPTAYTQRFAKLLQLIDEYKQKS